MMQLAAPIGAAGYLGGLGVSAIGQNQALRAMRDVWGDQMAQQRAYDAQVQAKAEELMSQINPTAVMGTAQQQQIQGKMGKTAGNLAAAVRNQTNRRRGNAEGKAVAAQASGGMLARAAQDAKLQSILAGLQNGGQNLDMLGRRYAMDTSMIRGDARRMASLAPLYERAAAMNGAWLRNLGGLAQMGGKAAMNLGFAQPMGGGESQPGSYVDETL